MRELARRAGISHAQVSGVISDRTNPGADFCLAVARALKDEPEKLMRMAGLLPALPPEVAEEEEAVTLFRRLDRRLRETVLITMRNLLGVQTVGNVPTPSERLQYEIRRELQSLPLREQEEVVEYIRALSERERGDNGALHGRPVDAVS